MCVTTCINLKNIKLSEKYISYLHEIYRISKLIPIERLVVSVCQGLGEAEIF